MKLVSIHKHVFLGLLVMFTGNRISAQTWTLQQLLDTALVKNKQLQIGRNNMEISDQKRQESISNFLPKVTAIADYRYFIELPYQLMPMSIFGGEDGQFREAQFGVPHNINANLQLTMPLYNPQLQGAVQMATIAGGLSDLQYQKSEELVFFEISNLYYNAQLLHHQLVFIQNNLINSRKLLQNMQLLNEQLLAKASDIKKVQLQLDQLLTQEERVQNQYEQVINALKFQVGIPLDENIDIDTVIVYQVPENYHQYPSIDMRIVKGQNRFLQQELKNLKQTRLPTLSLYGTYGAMGYGYDQPPNDFLNFYPSGFVGVQLNFPLFTGTTTRKKISQKKLELRNNQLQYQQTGEQSEMQRENASRQRNVSEKAISTTSFQIQLAQEVYDQAILQQNHGTATLTDILLADNDLREAQQNHLNFIIDYLKADLELKKLTGNFLNN